MAIRGKRTSGLLRWLGLGVAGVLYLHPSRAAVPCVFEEELYYPTPSVSWTPTPGADLNGNIAGYVVYWREDGLGWNRGPEVPCQRHHAVDAEDSDFFFCHGHRAGSTLAPGEIPWPLQRGLNLRSFFMYEFCVKAINLNGVESETCSNSVFICWAPYLEWWHPDWVP